MRSVEDKTCLSYGSAPKEMSAGATNGTTRGSSQQRTALGKPTPSKWDDAQKWIVNLSRVNDRNYPSKANQPRNSNADDKRLIAPLPNTDDYYNGGPDEELGPNNGFTPPSIQYYEEETKKIDYEEESTNWRMVNKSSQNPPPPPQPSAVRSICLRDMGTEMTPLASQEPSRSGTPIRVRTPAANSPISSGPSSPEGAVESDNNNNVVVDNNKNGVQDKKVSPMETRALAWDEAERAKYMARFKREEVKIEAWENHQKRKAEMEMKKMEVKAERLKGRAQEKYANKLAATKRIAEEKLANAEAKLNEQSVKTSESADYIRRTGHLPSSFSFKLPSCWCW